MNSRNINDQLEEIAESIELGKPLDDPYLVDLSTKLSSFRPSAFEDRLADIRDAKMDVESELSARLLSECEKVTKLAVSRYHQQLYFLFQSYYDEFRELGQLGEDLSQRRQDLASQSHPSLLDMYSEAITHFRGSLVKGKLDQEETCDSFVLIASSLFETILPIDNSAAHLQTVRDTLWTTLSTFSTLGLLEYGKVVRRVEPTQRRNLELRSADQALKFYETYYKSMVDWDLASKSWQLRVETSLKNFS